VTAVISHGLPGRLGGVMMARMNRASSAWMVDLLEVQGNDCVCEVGFGPGVGIQLLAQSAKYVAGVDPSPEMLRQATARNARAIDCGHVDLWLGSADRLPFDEQTFNKMLTINSLQMWPDAAAGVAEMRRVMKPGARIALGFTAYSRQSHSGLVERLTVAGFTDAKVAETEGAFCVVAVRP
jgi:ubiquinone/menaquinone biosynthesis C-methylase UbiE